MATSSEVCRPPSDEEVCLLWLDGYISFPDFENFVQEQEQGRDHGGQAQSAKT
jgi:hypothetical protein